MENFKYDIYAWNLKYNTTESTSKRLHYLSLHNYKLTDDEPEKAGRQEAEVWSMGHEL